MLDSGAITGIACLFLVLLGAWWVMSDNPAGKKPMATFLNGIRIHDFTSMASGHAVHVIWGDSMKYSVDGVGGDDGLPREQEMLLIKLAGGAIGKYRITRVIQRNIDSRKWSAMIKYEGKYDA